ncbi:MAG: hypothetical protein K2X47_10080 [Bdellovibrionales bacterium]|nr:hypothetical protein [Bdellovibrionales bacterium]
MRTMKLILIMSSLLVACTQGARTKNGPVSGGQAGQGTPPRVDQGAQGTINGGGGIGLQCGDHIEMLDVFEARQAGLTLVALPVSEEAAIQLVSQRLAQHFWNIETLPLDQSTKLMAKTFVVPIFEGKPIMNFETNKEENVEFVESLPLSNDFGQVTVPAGCSLVQIAYFSDSETRLSIVKSARDKMDLLSKAVLAAHEVIYLADRRDSIEKLKSQSAVSTSILTRKFIGQLFSTQPPPTKSIGVPPEGKLYVCKGSTAKRLGTYLYAFENEGTGKLSLVFKAIYGRSHLYQMRSDFKDLTLASMTEIDSETIQERRPLKFTGLVTPSGFEVSIKKQKGSAPIFELSYQDQSHQDQTGNPEAIRCEKY